MMSEQDMQPTMDEQPLPSGDDAPETDAAPAAPEAPAKPPVPTRFVARNRVVEAPAPAPAEPEAAPMEPGNPSPEEDSGLPLDGEMYTVGTWSGMPNYKCRYCEFSTPKGVEAINRHARGHFVPAPRKPSPLVGPNGQQL